MRTNGNSRPKHARLRIAGALAAAILVLCCGCKKKEDDARSSSSPTEMLPDAVIAKYVHVDGITIPSDDSSMPGGGTFTGARNMTFSLQGDGLGAILDTQGDIHLAEGGKIGRGTAKFIATRIRTSGDKDTWRKIVKMSINKGYFLVITDETGASYEVKFGGAADGEITPLNEAAVARKSVRKSSPQVQATPAQRAQRPTCEAHLRDLATSCYLYAQEHGDAFPSSLQELKASATPPKAASMRCPCGPSTRSEDYFYFAPARGGAGNAIALVICELDSGTHGPGRCCAYADGHAAFLSDDEFETELNNPNNARFAEAWRAKK